MITLVAICVSVYSLNISRPIPAAIATDAATMPRTGSGDFVVGLLTVLMDVLELLLLGFCAAELATVLVGLGVDAGAGAGVILAAAGFVVAGTCVLVGLGLGVGVGLVLPPDVPTGWLVGVTPGTYRAYTLPLLSGVISIPFTTTGAAQCWLMATPIVLLSKSFVPVVAFRANMWPPSKYNTPLATKGDDDTPRFTWYAWLRADTPLVVATL